MEELNDGLKIYSEEVRDVLSDPPKAILRWGNTILFGFIMILLLISWFTLLWLIFILWCGTGVREARSCHIDYKQDCLPTHSKPPSVFLSGRIVE